MLKQRLDEAQAKNANLMNEVSDLRKQVRATGKRRVDTESRQHRAASTPINERVSVPELTIPSNKEEVKLHDVRNMTHASDTTPIVDSGRPPPRYITALFYWLSISSFNFSVFCSSTLIFNF